MINAACSWRESSPSDLSAERRFRAEGCWEKCDALQRAAKTALRARKCDPRGLALGVFFHVSNILPEKVMVISAASGPNSVSVPFVYGLL
jgi:hypothetical protein